MHLSSILVQCSCINTCRPYQCTIVTFFRTDRRTVDMWKKAWDSETVCDEIVKSKGTILFSIQRLGKILYCTYSKQIRVIIRHAKSHNSAMSTEKSITILQLILRLCKSLVELGQSKLELLQVMWMNWYTIYIYTPPLRQVHKSRPFKKYDSTVNYYNVHIYIYIFNTYNN